MVPSYEHTDEIERFYESAILGLRTCNYNSILCKYVSNSSYNVPGFNMYVNELLIKACKNMKENALAYSLQEHDFHSSWEHVRHSKNKSLPLITALVKKILL